MDDLPCPTCGHLNPGDANFCSVCGGAVGDDEHRTATHEAVDLSGEQPVLVVVRGANAGSRFVLDDAVVSIGRHPDSTVLLDDVTVSRRHAEIRRVDGGLEILDAGSLNGTYVNGDRIERTPLAEGDQLQIGKYRMVVVVGGADGGHDGH